MPPSGKKSHQTKAPIDYSSGVSTEEENLPVRYERLVQTDDMGPEDAHTPTRTAVSWVVYEIRVCAASGSTERQIRGFPDIKCFPKETKAAQAWFRPEDYNDFLNGSAPGDVMPWDAMFAERITVFWFFEGPISPGLGAVLKVYVTHMFVWRRAHWERLHWIEMNRAELSHQQLYIARRELQKAWSNARVEVKREIKKLPEHERKVFLTEPGLWRRPGRWQPGSPRTLRLATRCQIKSGSWTPASRRVFTGAAWG